MVTPDVGNPVVRAILGGRGKAGMARLAPLGGDVLGGSR